jgi:hypothetical protein
MGFLPPMSDIQTIGKALIEPLQAARAGPLSKFGTTYMKRTLPLPLR